VLAQRAVYCITKLRWGLPDILQGVLAMPRSLALQTADDPEIMRRHRAFVFAAIDTWEDVNAKAMEKIKKKKGGK
jgi:hypothetical protein